MYNQAPVLLIWDIDGTLLTCKGSGKQAMTQAFHKIAGVPDGFDDVNMAGRVDRSILQEACQKHGIKQLDYPAFYQTYGEILEHCMAGNEEAHILSGVEQVLQKTHLSDRFYNVIGTGNCEVGAWLKLKHLKLDKYFEMGGFGTHVEERVNVIEQAIERARKQYDQLFRHPGAIFIIGDTPADITCGKALGVKSIAVATGGYPVQTLQDYEPDYLLDSLQDPEPFIKIFER